MDEENTQHEAQWPRTGMWMVLILEPVCDVLYICAKTSMILVKLYLYISALLKHRSNKDVLVMWLKSHTIHSKLIHLNVLFQYQCLETVITEINKKDIIKTIGNT